MLQESAAGPYSASVVFNPPPSPLQQAHVGPSYRMPFHMRIALPEMISIHHRMSLRAVQLSAVVVSSVVFFFCFIFCHFFLAILHLDRAI
jgi:hypothetical protein